MHGQARNTQDYENAENTVHTGVLKGNKSLFRLFLYVNLTLFGPS